MAPGPADGQAGSDRPKLPDLAALWDYNQPAETEKKFREILSQAEASGDLSYLLQLKTQIARTLGLQQRFEAAHQMLDEVELAIDQSSEDLRLVRVRSFLERGRALNSENKAEQAKPFFLKAWELGREIGAEEYAVDAAHMMAIVEKGSAAIPWFERGVALAEESEEAGARKWLGPLYNNLGWTYHDAGDYPRALEVFHKSLDWRAARQDTTGTRIAKWCVGRCLRSLGRVEEALEVQRALAGELEAAESQDGLVDEELGECLLALGRESEARPHFARAYRQLEGDIWIARDEPQRLERLRDLGGVEPDSTGP